MTMTFYYVYEHDLNLKSYLYSKQDEHKLYEFETT